MSYFSWLIVNRFCCEICHIVSEEGNFVYGYYENHCVYCCESCCNNHSTTCSDCGIRRFKYYMCQKQACNITYGIDEEYDEFSDHFPCCTEILCGVKNCSYWDNHHGEFKEFTEYTRMIEWPYSGYFTTKKGNIKGGQNISKYSEFRTLIGRYQVLYFLNKGLKIFENDKDKYKKLYDKKYRINSYEDEYLTL